MAVVLHLHQQPQLLQTGHHRLAGLEAIQPFELTGLFVHRAVFAHHRDLRKTMALADGEIVGIVSGRHLDATGAEILLHVVVGHDRDLPPHKGKRQGLAHQVGIAFVAGIHRHRRVAQHRFGAGGGDFQIALTPAEGIAEMPEMAIHLLHLHLQVTHRRTGGGTPVHEVFTAIDQPLLVQADEGLLHRFAQPLIQGEALSPPVHRVTQAPQLANDAPTAFRLPLPGPLQKRLSAEITACFALLLQLLLENRLHGNGRMIRTGQAEHIFPSQALVAHDRVDERRVEGMTHVQAAGDVRWRYHHRKRIARRLRIRVECPLVLPGLLPTRFRTNRVVGLGQFGHRRQNVDPAMLAKDPADPAVRL